MLGAEIARCGFEDGDVDAVMDDLDRVLLEVGLLYECCQPVGGGDEGHVGYVGEPFAF